MFDPYRKWLGIKAHQRPPTFYQLLGIDPDEDDAEVIEEAAIRQTTHVRAYQLGPHAAECTRILNEIAQARTTLLNPAKRQEYDAHLPKPAAPPAAHSQESAAAAPVLAFEDLASAVTKERRPEPPRRKKGRDDFDDEVERIRKPGMSPAVFYGLIGAGVAVPVLVVVGVLVALLGPKGEAVKAPVAKAPVDNAPPPAAPNKPAKGPKAAPENMGGVPQPPEVPQGDFVIQPGPKKVVQPVEFAPGPATQQVRRGVIEEDFPAVIKKEKHRYEVKGKASVACLSDNKHFLIASDGGVRIYERETGRVLRFLTAMGLGPICENPPRMLSDPRRPVIFLDLQTGKELSRFTKHIEDVTNTSLSSDASRAVSCEHTWPRGPGKVYLWDTASGKALAVLSGTDADGVLACMFFPGDQLVLLKRGGRGQKTRFTVWNPATGEERVFFTPPQPINLEHWALSPKGDRLLLLHSLALVVLDTRTGAVVTEIAIKSKSRRRVAFSPDGKRVAICGGVEPNGRPMDCYVHVVNLETTQEVCRFATSQVMWSIAFTPDGRHILTGAHGVASLWELPENVVQAAAASGPNKGGVDPQQPVGDAFVPLFNSKDLTGWKASEKIPGSWRVVNGILTGTGPNLGELYTTRDNYGDFQLRLEARTNDQAELTLSFRYPYGPQEIEKRKAGGYAVRISGRTDDFSKTGGLMVFEKVGLRNMMAKKALATAGQWFTLDITAKGNFVTTQVNGQQAISFQNPKTHLTGGRLVLGFGRPDRQSVIEFRKIEIKEFKAVPPPQP